MDIYNFISSMDVVVLPSWMYLPPHQTSTQLNVKGLFLELLLVSEYPESQHVIRGNGFVCDSGSRAAM